MTATINAFFDAIDAIVLRGRVYLKSLFGALLALQGLLAMNLAPFDFLKAGKWPTVVGLLNAVVGYYTLRSKRQADSLVEVERVGGHEAMARVPTPPSGPMFPPPGELGATPTSEMVTPPSRPLPKP